MEILDDQLGILLYFHKRYNSCCGVPHNMHTLYTVKHSLKRGLSEAEMPGFDTLSLHPHPPLTELAAKLL